MVVQTRAQAKAAAAKQGVTVPLPARLHLTIRNVKGLLQGVKPGQKQKAPKPKQYKKNSNKKASNILYTPVAPTAGPPNQNASAAFRRRTAPNSRVNVWLVSSSDLLLTNLAEF